MADTRTPPHLAVALDGAGWHPAAWRETDARPADLLTAGYWTDLAATAETGRLDFLTIEDSLGLQSDDPLTADRRTDRVRGRLDAVSIAARIAPRTSGIGLVPTAVATHTEPFHLSKAVATLDYVSHGRAGVRVQVAAAAHVAQHIGRRRFPPLTLDDLGTEAGRVLAAELFGEARDYIEVLRRLWDSWEDGAEIRDAASGRFIDRSKLHYIDFAGEHFRVRGPSITPRPPQGQPIVAALGHGGAAYELIGTSADVGFITPKSADDAAASVAAISAQERSGRAGETVHVFGDLVVVLDRTAPAARDRLARLDEFAGAQFDSDAFVFAGTPAELADLLEHWQYAGLSGFRLRPAVLPHDLNFIAHELTAELSRRGGYRTAYPDRPTLRGLLGLDRPVSRFAESERSPR